MKAMYYSLFCFEICGVRCLFNAPHNQKNPQKPIKQTKRKKKKKDFLTENKWKTFSCSKNLKSSLFFHSFSKIL